MIQAVLLFSAAALLALFVMACVLRDAHQREQASYRAYLDRLEEMARD